MLGAWSDVIDSVPAFAEHLLWRTDMDVLCPGAADAGGPCRVCLPAHPLPQPAGQRGAYLHEGRRSHLVSPGSRPHQSVVCGGWEDFSSLLDVEPARLTLASLPCILAPRLAQCTVL